MWSNDVEKRGAIKNGQSRDIYNIENMTQTEDEQIQQSNNNNNNNNNNKYTNKRENNLDSKMGVWVGREGGGIKHMPSRRVRRFANHDMNI